MMEAGQLRHFVTVQRWVTTGTDSDGAALGAWETMYANVPATVEKKSGSESELVRQIKANATWEVTIRYLPDITTLEQLIYGTKKLGIASIDNVGERNETLVMTCGELPPEESEDE